MKIVVLLIAVGLALGGVVEAKRLKSTPITDKAVRDLMRAQASPVLAALREGNVVVAAVGAASSLRSGFALHPLPVIGDRQSIIDTLKTVVNRREDNIGYVFVPTASGGIEQYEYSYYTSTLLEWVEIAGEKINIPLTPADVLLLSDSYTLKGVKDALRENHFYMEHYDWYGKASVRYLKELNELRAESESEFPARLRNRLHRHMRGEKVLTAADLRKIDALIEPSHFKQWRRWQASLAALKAELTAETLLDGLLSGKLARDNFTAAQVEMAERIVRLKNAKIANIKKTIEGGLNRGDSIIIDDAKILAYFKKHQDTLRHKGIVIAVMAKEFIPDSETLDLDENYVIAVGVRLGKRIGIMKKNLANDTEHFIHKIIPAQSHIDGKSTAVYTLRDPDINDKILTYFEEHRAALRGEGIAITAMAKELGLRSGNMLGAIIRAMRQDLKHDKEHLINRIISQRKSRGDETISFYRLP